MAFGQEQKRNSGGEEVGEDQRNARNGPSRSISHIQMFTRTRIPSAGQQRAPETRRRFVCGEQKSAAIR